MDVHFYRILMITVGVLICLITLTSQLVHSKVIMINITSGNSSPQCCTEEGCMCASLTVALQYINSSTTINITSSSVMLEESVKLGSNHTSGSGNLTDITITGSNVTIMCNNSGSVYCESCSNVKIEGITWDRCGDLNGANVAGVTFNSTNNISLAHCTFRHSMQTAAVYFLKVFGIASISNCNFLSNCGAGLYIHDCNIIYFGMSDSYFYDNGFYCYSDSSALHVYDGGNDLTIWHINITKTMFLSNMNAVTFNIINSSSSIHLVELIFNNNGNASSTLKQFTLDIELVYGINSTVSLFNTLFSDNIGASLLWDVAKVMKAEIMIVNSNFTHNQRAFIELKFSVVPVVQITIVDVEISHDIAPAISNKGGNLLISFFDDILPIYNYKTMINLTRVSVISNQYLGDLGGAIYIEYNFYDHQSSITFQDCEFYNNTSIRGAAFCIVNNYNGYTAVSILNSKIHHNVGEGSVGSVIYVDSNKAVDSMIVIITSSNFTNNFGSSMHLLYTHLICLSAVFANNTADNGAALYIDQGSVAYISGKTVQFINNSATENGGAIFANLIYTCALLIFTSTLNGTADSMAMFVNNTAEVSGNSIYFYIPAYCKVESNISSFTSILYAPCQFNYSQPVNGKMMNIPCDLDYTLLNGTGAPIVTSPHELRLFFPYNDGYNISSNSDHNIYFIRSNVLGYPVKFTGAVFDYFGKPAEPTQFDVQCVNCLSSITLPKVHFLVGNISSLSITFTGANVESRVSANVTLTSTVRSIKQITTTLVVELLPCIDHPGYTYSTAHKACVCYHHNVDCHDSYNEIKRGYWFGSVSNTATTAPCPHYCKFTGRTETRQGYFELPSTIDAQCNDHRVGRVCGECSSGYTLSYDSTDCISVDQCGAGWTVLVITLTCLYWIAVVAGVFGLMYFKVQISLGYLYGLIYYYSVIRILLDNNPNLSDGVFQFASVLSSFAQLTPQFLGELCFVKGLSGIDQLFIHYSHAVGVSLLLLLIVVAARWSSRVTSFVSRCIIRVICLLILLSYTSIVSTSLQLLQPLRFTDVKEWYTYSSPNIQYFHGRHAVYGVVAIICELVVGIGLPLLLLLQPFLSRKINFIRIKPLLDQFQGCYRDKYRWFAAYYLICRQVIFLIAYTINSNYYDTAFYLQTVCVVIASIHIWIQPYQSNLLNGLDGVMLLLMIQANGFAYIKDSLTTVLEIMTITLPLIMFCAFFIRKGIHSCRKKERHYRYVNINNDDGVTAEENIIRNADEIDEPQPHNQNYNTFEESLLDFSYMQQ